MTDVGLRIPAFSTVATLIDRLSNESIRLTDLEDAIEDIDRSTEEIAESTKQAAGSGEVVASIRSELAGVLNEAFLIAKHEGSEEVKSVETHIPNLNTLSTLIDRLIVENVKLVHFEKKAVGDDLPVTQAKVINRKMAMQHEIIGALRKELARFMEEVTLSGNYRFFKEERTFG